MEYKFKDDEKEKDLKPEERTIVKTGHVVEFSLVEMMHDTHSFEKTLRELKGNRDMKKSVMDNIDIHHPSIKEIPEFDRYTIHMYQEAFAMVKAYNAKIEEIEKQYADYKVELADIKKAIPELADIPSPYVDNPEKRFCAADGCEAVMIGDERHCEAHAPKAEDAGVDNSKKEDGNGPDKTE